MVMMKRTFVSIRFTFSDDDSVLEAIRTSRDIISEDAAAALEKRIKKVEVVNKDSVTFKWVIDDSEVYTKGFYYIVGSNKYVEIFTADAYDRTFITTI